MTGPTARGVAAQTLVRVLTGGAFAAAALDAEIARSPQLDARDRGFATELVYGALRALPWLEARLDERAKKPVAKLHPRVRAHMVLAAYQVYFLRVPPFAAVDACVGAVRAIAGAQVAGFANAVLRRLVREKGEPSYAEAVAASCPEWLRAGLERALGAEGAARFLAEHEPPPLGLRVRRGTREEWVAALRTAGAEVEAGRAGPAAILARGTGKANVGMPTIGGEGPQGLPGVAAGALVIQEEGSQLVAASVGARPGETVLDACAGRGNKTLALLDAGATVDACDLHESKLRRLKEEASRLGVAPRATFAVDWTVGCGDVTGAYDAVLVDAPCSGVGTIRRRPDLLLRREDAGLAALARTQLAILGAAASRVRPGGRLVYAVCSVLREEAEDVVQAFLAATPEMIAAPFAGAAVDGIAAGGVTLRLLPYVHGTNGYFLAGFRRPA